MNRVTWWQNISRKMSKNSFSFNLVFNFILIASFFPIIFYNVYVSLDWLLLTLNVYKKELLPFDERVKSLKRCLLWRINSMARALEKIFVSCLDV